MYPLDDVNFAQLIAEAGYDWQYARSQSRDRDIDKPYPRPTREPRGPSVYGVAQHIWDSLSDNEKELQKQRYVAGQTRQSDYQKRMDDAISNWKSENEPASSASIESEPKSKASLPSDAPPEAVAISGNYYIDSYGNHIGYAPGASEPLPEYDPWAEEDWHDWPDVEKSAKPVEPGEEIRPPATRGPSKISLKDTPEYGLARVLDVDLAAKPGYIVVNDKYPEIPLDGPYDSEMQAQNEMYKVAAKLADDHINELSKNGPVDDAKRARIKDSVLDSLSYRFYNPSKEVRQPKDTSRRYEYGTMRAKQLEMFETGSIKEVKDENLDSDYLNNPKPRLENLKKVWCPLILDKANPPRKPWTLDQVTTAMMPIINRQVYNWTGGGFHEDEALAVCLTAVMKALINDKGMSPFPNYANWWIRGDLYRAKKTQGVIRRPAKEKGWGNQGLSSTDNPLIGAEGGEEGTVSSTIRSETPSYEKITCPDCGGSKKSDRLTREACTYCSGTGKYADGTVCGLCKGEGSIQPPCPSCGGTGRIVLVTKDDELRGQGLDIFKDEDGNYHIDGNIAGMEKQELLEKLNRAGRLVQKLMDVSNLTSTQQEIVNLRFGLKTGHEYGATDIARMLRSRCKSCGALNLGNLDNKNNVTDPVCKNCGGTISGLGTKQGVELTLKKILDKLRNTIVNIGNKRSGKYSIALHPEEPHLWGTEIEPIEGELLDLFDWFTDYQKEFGLMDLKDVEGKEGWITRPYDSGAAEEVVTRQRDEEAKQAKERTTKSGWDPEKQAELLYKLEQQKLRDDARREHDIALKRIRDRQNAVGEGINLMKTVLMEYVNIMEAIRHKAILEEISNGGAGTEILECI